MQQLHGSVALITGAGSGIGLETARLLARDGATIALTGRRRPALEDAARSVEAEGGTALVIPTDITDHAAVHRLVSDVRAAVGSIDILVNNAGAGGATPNPLWTSPEEWSTIVATNLHAVFSLTQAVLPDMLARGGGSVITVSSLAADNPNLLGGAAYGAAKAGVRNFMQFLHTTFRAQGIRSTTILPGEVDTPIMDTRVRPPSPEERAAMAQPEDVARAIHLAASLPARTVIPEIVIAPTRQRDTSGDLEISRWKGAPDGMRPA